MILVNIQVLAKVSTNRHGPEKLGRVIVAGREVIAERLGTDRRSIVSVGITVEFTVLLHRRPIELAIGLVLGDIHDG